MSVLGDLFASIIRELVIDPMERLHANHVNKRKPGDPDAVYAGPLGRTVAVIGSAFFIPLGLVVAWTAVSTFPIADALIIVTLFGGVAIWFGRMTYDSFVRRIEWNETDVRFRKWNSDRTIAWEDIAGLEVKQHPPHTRIVFRDGSGFGIHETMHGSRYFMGLLEQRLGQDAPGGGKRRRRK